MYEAGGFIGGFLFGLVYSPIVITGLHQSFPPIELQLQQQGGSFIFATASMANIAQGAATLAVFFLAKGEKLKGLAGASGVSAVLGISFAISLRIVALLTPNNLASVTLPTGAAISAYCSMMAAKIAC